MAEGGDEFFGETKALSLNGEIGATSHQIEGGAEGVKSRFVDGLDRDDGSDTYGEGEKIEEGKGFVSEKVSTPVDQENAERVEPVQG